MILKIRKAIVKLRMWYADLRGHHGKRWNYEPSHHYMRRKIIEKLDEESQEYLKKLKDKL